jgi:hypothetical protein
VIENGGRGSLESIVQALDFKGVEHSGLAMLPCLLPREIGTEKSTEPLT